MLVWLQDSTLRLLEGFHDLELGVRAIGLFVGLMTLESMQTLVYLQGFYAVRG